MELVLSGNLLMLKPWLPQLSGELSFWRRDYNPTMKTKMTEERMYFTHTVEGVEVGYVPEGLLERVQAYLRKHNIVFTTIDHREWSMLPTCDFSHVDVLDLREGQDVALVRVGENYNGVIEAPTGFGKCMDPDTPVLMYSGEVKSIGDIEKEELVMGDDSTPRTVLDTVLGTDDMYTITPVKGEPFTVTSGHQLSLKKTGTETVINISVKDYLQQSNNFKHLHKLYRVPVQFNDVDISIDPYFIGLWVGDGLWSRPLITTEDSEVIEYLEEYADTLGLNCNESSSENRCSSYLLAGKVRKKKGNILINRMKEYGLLKVPSKFIPKDFYINSEAKRLQLLAGLIDSDGTRVVTTFEIYSVHKYLADQYCFLARSLGFYSKVTKKYIRSGPYEGHVSYRVCINGDTSRIPTRIQRKKAPVRRQIKSVLKTGFSVEYKGKGNYAGLILDKNHLYVMGDFTVTHNTFLIRQICKMYPLLNITVCTPRKSVVKSIYERLTADSYLRDNIGVISSWKNTGADYRVTVSTVRSLLKTNYEKCDLLLFDECQGVGAVGTAETLAKFTRARKFGFSASPEGRGDGADLVLESLFGPVRFDFSYQQAVDTGSVVPIEAHLYPVKGDPISKQGKIALKRWGIWRNTNRNKKIAEVVNKFRDDDQVLIISETIEHAMNLKKLLPDYKVIFSNCSKERYAKFVKDGYTSDPYLSDKEMMEEQSKFESGELVKCISTMVFREGVDFKHLMGLVRADGQAGVIPSTQIPGRLSRLDENKDRGILIDFIDEFDDRLQRASYSRIKHYKNLNWNLIYEDKL